MATSRGFGLLLLYALSGCGSEQLKNDSNDAGTGGAPAEGGAAPECPAPGYAEPSDPVRVGTFSATVEDSSGNPMTGVLAQVCGIDLCINVDVLDNGSVTHAVNADFIKPAFKYGDGVGYAKFAQLLEPDAAGSVELGTVVSFALPDLGGAVELAPGSTARSGAVELELAADFVATIDPFDFDTPAEQGFRAVDVPLTVAPPAVDASLGLELVYALTPAAALLCPAAVLTVANTPGWPAGTAVDVFVHGVSIEEPWAPYAGWAKVSDAEVSADGASITTRGHAGLPTLSVIGLRRTP